LLGGSSTLSPMLLTSARTAPPGPHAYEVKWDGFRVLVEAGRGSTRIWSRRGTDFTTAFPELADLSRALAGRTVLLDGELVCFDPSGRTSFGRVRQRWLGRPRAHLLAKMRPATLVIFDVLFLDGTSVMALPYEERRALLTGLALADNHWLVTEYYIAHDGDAVVAASRQQRYEGVVAKRLGSRYRPGVRSPDWMKIKNYERGWFGIGGWLADAAGRVEALLVGRAEAGRLRYCGTVEFGLDGQRRTLRELLEVVAVEQSPFEGGGPGSRRCRYVDPRLEAAVRFIGWDGPVLREAIFEGARLACPQPPSPA
jgi:bifunctional non-homologous end joining protein LigD